MKTLIMAVMLMLPSLAGAASDCNVVEYQDRFEAICVGEDAQTPGPGPGWAEISAPTPPAAEPPQLQEKSEPATEIHGITTARSTVPYRQSRIRH